MHYRRVVQHVLTHLHATGNIMYVPISYISASVWDWSPRQGVGGGDL